MVIIRIYMTCHGNELPGSQIDTYKCCVRTHLKAIKQFNSGTCAVVSLLIVALEFVLF